MKCYLLESGRFSDHVTSIYTRICLIFLRKKIMLFYYKLDWLPVLPAPCQGMYVFVELVKDVKSKTLSLPFLWLLVNIQFQFFKQL